MLKVPFPLVGGYGLASLSAFKWADASHLAHHGAVADDDDDGVVKDEVQMFAEATNDVMDSFIEDMKA